ncbi:hypothetical protein C943_04251 [Mariniradius saccharolyticus AK6]|uniref:Uncharacterized protein n=1 Tax=Mariniradius saccharolyticus AK6 TaxID=1239962 RepID=M7XZL3_9BACT|nr:hypothetical protein C943_04251 [Mariniradius saccharolyticus AK6]
MPSLRILGSSRSWMRDFAGKRICPSRSLENEIIVDIFFA